MKTKMQLKQNLSYRYVLRICLLYSLLLLLYCNAAFAQVQQKEVAFTNPNFYTLKSKWESKLQTMNEEVNPFDTARGPMEDGEYAKYWRWYTLWRYRIGEDGEMITASKAMYELSKEGLLNNVHPKTRVPCDPADDNGIYWTNLGPFNSSGAKSEAKNCYSSGAANKQNQGRVECISVSNTNQNDILIGGHNGGIWKSTNGGSTWTNTTDDEGYSIFGIQSIARHPANQNIIYASTSVGGGLWESARSVYGMGIIVSTDGGTSWQPTGLNYSTYGTWNSQLGEIAIDPTSTTTNTKIYVTSNTDIWKWEGGHLANGTWTSIYNNGTYYGGPLWYGYVNNNDIVVNNSGTVFFSNFMGLFKYQSGLVTQINSYTVPSAINTSTNCGSPSQNLRSHMNIEMNNQGHLIMLIAYNSCTSSGKYIYKSTDNGVTWSTPKLVNIFHNASNRYPMLTVSKNNSDIIYTETSLRCAQKSTNFGTSFSSMNNYENHVDIRCLVSYSGSGSNDNLYIGTDGGLSKTTDGNTWTDITGQGLSLTNYYGCGIKENTDKEIYAGAQDGSINFYTNGSWYETNPGGDNGDCMVNPTNPNMIFQESQHSLHRGTVTGNDVNINTSYGNACYTTCPTCSCIGWMNPLKWNGNSTNEFFYGNDFLKVGLSTGTSLTTITTSLHSGKNISSVEVSRKNSDVVYYATDSYVWSNSAPTDDGIYKASRSGTTWTVSNISSNLYGPVNGLNGLSTPITDIATDPNDENRIWITMGNFDAAKKVYYTSNGGTSWSNITLTGLPNLPCTAIAFQEMSNDRIYVGTDNGIYYKDNSMTCWARYANNGPQCMVNDMEINNCSGKLVVATHGRGLWEVPLIINQSNTLSTGTITWNTPRTIANNLIIPSGCILNISNTTINIAKGIKITVQKGGRINISNSTLTNSCGYTWFGVDILGNNTLTQTFANQGAVVISNSTIEHAEEAFTIYDGGILQADVTNFFNNKRSVAYVYYLLNNNIAYFKNCNFKTDLNYRHAGSLLTHFSMWSVKGMNILGCNFETTNNFPWDAGRVGGIVAIDANFTIDQLCIVGTVGCSGYIKSSFKGLHKAIKTDRTTGSFTFNVYNSTFENNVYGIITTGHNAFNIRANSFKVGKSSVGNNVVHEGISIFSGSLFNVDQNSFEPLFTLQTQPTTIGIRVTGAGSSVNEIYKNSFSKLSTSNSNIFYANLANATNRNNVSPANGLKYYCNTNINNINSGYDFAVTDSGIANMQGSLTFPTKNTFSLGTGTPNSDFINSAITGNINYYHGLPVNEIPVNKLQVINFITSSTNNTCPDRYVYNSGGSSSKTEQVKENLYYTVKGELDKVTLQLKEESNPELIKTLESSMADLQTSMTRICKEAIQYYSGELNKEQEIVIWYNRLNTIESKMAAIDILIEQNQSLLAQQNLNELLAQAISVHYDLPAIQGFISLKNIQLNALKKSPRYLTTLDKEELNNISFISTTAGIAGEQAKAILNYYGDTLLTPPVFPKQSDNSLVGSNTENNVTHKLLYDVVAIPNPAHSQVKFETNMQIKNGEIVKLVVTNNFGSTIKILEFSSEKKYVYWDCSQINPGSYYFSVYNKEDKKYITKNLIISK